MELGGQSSHFLAGRRGKRKLSDGGDLEGDIEVVRSCSEERGGEGTLSIIFKAVECERNCDVSRENCARWRSMGSGGSSSDNPPACLPPVDSGKQSVQFPAGSSAPGLEQTLNKCL